MQATGNDFLILDGTECSAPAPSLRPQMAQTHCQRTFGFGADGFLVLEKKADQVHWDFYNSDGSSANMCGNAARTVALLLMNKYKSDSIDFVTKVGKVFARRVESQEIEVQFEIPSVESKPLSFHSAVLIDTGVPHVVVRVENLQDMHNLRETGLEIKSKYSDNGMNVTFYVSKSPNKIESTTFERGVEDFTLSCGTGALAAARIHLKQKDGQCEVTVPGGKLNVAFQKSRATLRGPAQSIGWCTPSERDPK